MRRGTALAARGTNNGLWDWDLQTDEIYYSSRWKAMLGHEDGEISSSPKEWFGRVHPDDVERLRTHLAHHRQEFTPHFECEHRLAHKDQTYRWVLAAVWPFATAMARGFGWRARSPTSPRARCPIP